MVLLAHRKHKRPPTGTTSKGNTTTTTTSNTTTKTTSTTSSRSTTTGIIGLVYKCIIFLVCLLVTAFAVWLVVHRTTKTTTTASFANNNDFLSILLQVGQSQQQQQQQQTTTIPPPTPRPRPVPPPRFVTVVDSGSEVNHEGRYKRLTSIRDTWGGSGGGGNAIFVVNNNTDPKSTEALSSLSSVDVVVDNTTTNTNNDNRDENENESVIWPKLLFLPPNTVDRSIQALQYTIRTIVERINPDFALFTNDHTYVIPNHLCQYIRNNGAGRGGVGVDDPNTQHLYAGHALTLKDGSATFHPMSSGYVLSRYTMESLIKKWDTNDPICTNPNERHPGRFLSRCLLETMNVLPLDTRDYGDDSNNDSEGRHRFHAFPIMRLVTGQVDSWYLELSSTPNAFGIDCCSNNTITFHYVEYMESKALFAVQQFLLKQQKEEDDDDDEELKNYMIQVWPNNPKDIGGYSRPLPSANDDQSWKTLLTVIRQVLSTTATKEGEDEDDNNDGSSSSCPQ